MRRKSRQEPRANVVNRYETYGEIASGGMATVEYGRLFGAHEFTRPVAIKRLHAQFAKDPAFAAMFIDEARLSARLIHANIIPTLDVIQRPGEIALVMEYVHGEALSSLLQLACSRGELVPIKVATALVSSVLHGLHAAHETRDERDRLLGVVHRDVSPHNILVGVDGVPRILDFGIAKAVDQLRTTPSGEIKGKLAYIAPEQLRGQVVDRRADIFGAAAVLWETLTGFMLFQADNASVLVQRVLDEPIKPPSAHVKGIPAELDAIVMRGLARDFEKRYPTAREMALELERKVGIATQSEVTDWLLHLASDVLAARSAKLRKLQERGGAPVLGPNAPAGSDLRNTRLLQSADREAPFSGSTPPSIETQSRTTEVLMSWPWLAVGLSMLAAALLMAAWLRKPEEASTRHALAPVVVPIEPADPPVTAQPAVPAQEAQPIEPLPTGVSAPAEETPAPAAAIKRAPASKPVSQKGAARSRALDLNTGIDVKPAAITEPKCSPIVYIDGIRSLNPDCPGAARPKH
jgi:serine/threonine-protein kinase